MLISFHYLIYSFFSSNFFNFSFFFSLPGDCSSDLFGRPTPIAFLSFPCICNATTSTTTSTQENYALYLRRDLLCRAKVQHMYLLFHSFPVFYRIFHHLSHKHVWPEFNFHPMLSRCCYFLRILLVPLRKKKNKKRPAPLHPIRGRGQP